MSERLLEVKHLQTSFFTDSGEVKAVNDISFNLDAGKVLGIVGESGSGKSVSAYSVMQILDYPGRIKGGSILLKGKDLTTFTSKEMEDIRGERIILFSKTDDLS